MLRVGKEPCCVLPLSEVLYSVTNTVITLRSCCKSLDEECVRWSQHTSTWKWKWFISENVIRLWINCRKWIRCDLCSGLKNFFLFVCFLSSKLKHRAVIRQKCHVLCGFAWTNISWIKMVPKRVSTDYNYLELSKQLFRSDSEFILFTYFLTIFKTSTKFLINEYFTRTHLTDHFSKKTQENELCFYGCKSDLDFH